jgi:hypothetical protein
LVLWEAHLFTSFAKREDEARFIGQGIPKGENPLLID